MHTWEWKVGNLAKKNKMKFDFKDILFIVIVIAMSILLFNGCKARRKIIKQNLEIVNYEDSVLYYKSKTGNLIASNKALKVSNVNQIKGLKKDLKELRLKKPKVVIRYKNKIKIDSVKVLLEIPCEEFSKKINIDSSYYKIIIDLTNRSLLLRSIIIPNEQSIIVANKKERWWRPSEYSVVVKNSNPNIKSTGLQSYTIKPEKKLYEKKWFWITVGLTGGLYLGNKIRIN